ncbi:MAG: GntR family transcriptional regulator, partial [Arenicella sp.]|nr:GntR family transcriptional regulator [Arenicella sp.]
MTVNSHHDIRQALRGRIESGEWQLGALIPGEMALADEYGCARTTINRALQTLANDGLVIRKRKGGTRVCEMPVRQAKFEIPILREQV